MTSRNPLHNDPKVSTRGQGNYGVRFTRFVESGAPGGYSVVEVVDLFPTREERDHHLSALRRKWRSTRKYGPIIEAFEVEVAGLGWFEPVYLRSVVIADELEHPYGLVRIYDTEPPTYDFLYARDEEELRWMLAAQWDDALPATDEPRALYDVVFFTPDEPPRLHIVIEQDDDVDDESEGTP